MSLTTWLDATVTQFCPLGVIGHRITTTSTEQRSVITWEFGTRSVLLGESTMLGRKRAMYEVINNPRVIATIRKLEAEAALAECEALIAEARALGIDVGNDNDGEWMPSVEDEAAAKMASLG